MRVLACFLVYLASSPIQARNGVRMSAHILRPGHGTAPPGITHPDQLTNKNIVTCSNPILLLKVMLIRLIWNVGRRSPNKQVKGRYLQLAIKTRCQHTLPELCLAGMGYFPTALKFSLPARKRKLGLAALMNLCSRFLPFTGWTPGRKLLELRARALRPKQVHFAPTLRARL